MLKGAMQDPQTSQHTAPDRGQLLFNYRQLSPEGRAGSVLSGTAVFFFREAGNMDIYVQFPNKKMSSTN